MNRYLKIAILLSVGLLAPSMGRAESDDLRKLKSSIRQITGDNQFRSIKGFDFNVYKFEQPNAKKRLLVQGGLHGNEFLASDFVLWLADRTARGESLLNLVKDYSVDFAPYANPDGTFLANRLNGRQVNLNRNFEVFWGESKEQPGAYAFSEVETRAIKALFEKRNYDVAVDVHGFVNWFVSPSQPKYMAEKLSPARKIQYDQWTQILKNRLPKDYEFHTAKDLGDGGAFEDWAYWKKGAFAFCFELSTRERFITETFESIQSFVVKALVSTPGRKDANPQKDLFMDYEKTLYQILTDVPTISSDSYANVH